MSIADAPLWAQTPTAEVVRRIEWSAANAGATEPFQGDLSWIDLSESWEPEKWGPLFGLRIPEGLYVEEVRRLWEALGDLLAIEAVHPATAIVAPGPWSEVDFDGCQTRYPATPDVDTGAVTSDRDPITARVELWERKVSDSTVEMDDPAEVRLLTENGDSVTLATADDARSLAFALLKAARVADMVTEGLS